MTRNRIQRRNLGLSHPKNAFLFTVVNFNLPSVEIRLHQLLCLELAINDEQIGWLPILGFGIRREFAGLRGNHQESQKFESRSTLPKHVFNFFEPYFTSLASKPNFCLLPRKGGILSNLFRGKLFRRVLAPPAGTSGPAQFGVLAASCNKNGSVRIGFKYGLVAKTAIHSRNHLPATPPCSIDFRPDIAHYFQGLCGEIKILFCLAILFLHGLISAFAGFLERRRFLTDA